MTDEAKIGPFKANPWLAAFYMANNVSSRRLFHELSHSALQLFRLLADESSTVGTVNGGRIKVRRRAYALFESARKLLVEDPDYTQLQENHTYCEAQSYYVSGKPLDPATRAILRDFDGRKVAIWDWTAPNVCSIQMAHVCRIFNGVADPEETKLIQYSMVALGAAYLKDTLDDVRRGEDSDAHWEWYRRANVFIRHVEENFSLTAGRQFALITLVEMKLPFDTERMSHFNAFAMKHREAVMLAGD